MDSFPSVILFKAFYVTHDSVMEISFMLSITTTV